MMTFKLDTSGAVNAIPPKDRPELVGFAYAWSDLSPFVQGYIEAALADLQREIDAHRYGLWMRVAFHNLAPETLARFIEDCDVAESWNAQGNSFCDRMTAGAGADYWRDRQAGRYLDPKLPKKVQLVPIVLYLADDGKIRIKEGA